MAFTTESIETPIPSASKGPAEFDLPVKEFVGYDPKGTTTITGSAISENKIPKQQVTNEEHVVETEEITSLSPKISALARKEQAQRQREQKFKEERQAFADKLAKAEKYDQLQAKLANKDFSGAEEMGLTYEQYVDYKLKQQESADPREERLTRHEQEIAELKKTLEEKEVKEYQLNQQLWKQEISKTLDDNEEFSSLRKDPRMKDIILQHINDSFDEDNVELTAEQAAREIKAALKARAKQMAPFLEDDERPAPARSLGPPKSSPKTITNNMTVTSKTTQSKPFHLMSESEQIAEAYRRVQEQKLKQRGL